MIKNKNGFTLVELISVLVILMLLFILAVSRVRHLMDENEKNSYRASATSYIKAINDYVTLQNGVKDRFKFQGLFDVDELDELQIKVSGTAPDGGFAYVVNDKVSYACLTYEEYKVIYKQGKITSITEGTCRFAKGYNKGMNSYFAEYTGSEQTFTIPKTGKYLLEVWGAEGGSVNDSYYGGKGAYARGYIDLQKDDVLYINVGGKGKNSINNGNNTGGYNGGGDSYAMTGSCGNKCMPGGGATSIATSSGLLSTLNKTDVLIVAGGGGGAAYRYCNANDYGYSSGGNAGGISGSDAKVIQNTYNIAIDGSGGTQTSGGIGAALTTETGAADGTYGHGGYTTRTGGYTCSSGGGGGLYGGGNGMFIGAGGGSSYIGNSNLTDKEMYCIDCEESINLDTKTFNTETATSNPISYNAKSGNGYAIISFIE